MKSNYKSIGELVERIDQRNTDGTITNLIGVSIDKRFIPSVANVIGTDLTKYKVIEKYDFAVSLMQVSRDEKIPVACQTDFDRAIMSPAYPIFRVKDTNVILPEYLEMWFMRPEFDREASFIAVGGVRGSMPWDDFANMKLPVPSIMEQHEIVSGYKAITERIKLKKQINDNLEAQAFAIYKETISNREKCAMLSDIAEITMGTSPEGESFNADGIGTVFYQGRTDFGFRFPTIRLYTTEPKRFADKGDVLMSVRAPVGDINIAKEHCAIGRGLAALKPKNKCYSYLYYTMMELNFELKKFNDEGTVFGSITKDDLFALNVVALSPNESISFEKKVSIIDDTIFQNETEIQHLLEMSSILLSKITD